MQDSKKLKIKTEGIRQEISKKYKQQIKDLQDQNKELQEQVKDFKEQLREAEEKLQKQYALIDRLQEFCNMTDDNREMLLDQIKLQKEMEPIQGTMSKVMGLYNHLLKP